MSDPSSRPAPPRPVILCVLDGWGFRTERQDNAIALAATPHWDALWAGCPTTTLDASGLAVGLPEGQMGNSEVGHMNLGAGRVVMQDYPRIDQAIKDGSLAANPELAAFIAALRQSGGACHLLGLISPGGVHSHQNQIAVLARLVAQAGVSVRIHALLDGRDTPPVSAQGFLEAFATALEGAGDIRISTLGGRYFAMDRDKRWDRVEKAYDVIVDAAGPHQPDWRTALAAAYAGGANDEFVPPVALGDYAGMRNGDGILMGNFRADRARQILAALADPDFGGFLRRRVVHFQALAGLVEYSSDLARRYSALFPPQSLTNILGEVVSRAGLTQLRIAETEKYAHVTFFLNGGEEQVFPGEERILVPSPKVATYDLQPEMAAPEVTDKLVAAIDSGRFDLIVVNFANGDMVGHTGILDAAIKAAQTIDTSLGRLERAVRAAGGVMLVTADHGNAELMRDPETGQPHTAHTLDPVPVILVNPPDWAQRLHPGRLADVAPTLLALMGLPQPAEMTGHSLIEPRDAA